MKLLLDENLPKRLKSAFAEHEIYTVYDKGWHGKKNGELMQLLVAENFDALLTFDKNSPHQQNLQKYALPVLILNAPDNTCFTLKNLVPGIKDTLNKTLVPGPTIIN